MKVKKDFLLIKNSLKLQRRTNDRTASKRLRKTNIPRNEGGKRKECASTKNYSVVNVFTTVDKLDVAIVRSICNRIKKRENKPSWLK